MGFNDRVEGVQDELQEIAKSSRRCSVQATRLRRRPCRVFILTRSSKWPEKITGTLIMRVIRWANKQGKLELF